MQKKRSAIQRPVDLGRAHIQEGLGTQIIEGEYVCQGRVWET